MTCNGQFRSIWWSLGFARIGGPLSQVQQVIYLLILEHFWEGTNEEQLQSQQWRYHATVLWQSKVITTVFSLKINLVTNDNLAIVCF